MPHLIGPYNQTRALSAGSNAALILETDNYRNMLTNGIQVFDGSDPNCFKGDMGDAWLRNTSFTIGFFLRMDAITTRENLIVLGSADSTSYDLFIEFNNAGPYVVTQWFSELGGYKFTASASSSIAATTYVTCLFEYDLDAGEARWLINGVGSGPVSTGMGGGIRDSGFDTLYIGAGYNGASPFSGRIGNISVWNRVLTGAEITEWHNSGTPKYYDALSSGLKSGLVHHWNGSEIAGRLRDSVGGKHLSPVGTRSTVIEYGTSYVIPYNTAGDNYTIAEWRDTSGQDNHATQATEANRGTWIPRILNNRDILEANGSSVAMSLTSAIALSGDFTVVIPWVVAGTATTYLGHSSGSGYIDQTNSTTLTLSNDAGSTLALTHSAISNILPSVIVIERLDNTVTVSINGTKEAAGTLSGTITVDQIFNRTSGNGANVDVPALAVYTSAQDARTIGQITEQLSRKYV